jgi:hypothetical protein
VKTTFFCKNFTKKILKSQITKFAKLKHVSRVIYNKRAIYINGSYSPSTKVIYICDKLKKKPTLHTFFHELSHHVACQQKEWKAYHFDLKIFSSDNVFLLENRIDKLASQLWSENVDQKIWGKYKYSYPIKNKKTLLCWINKHMKTKNTKIKK